MSDTVQCTAAPLSDGELVRRVVFLAAQEREATVELVAHLAELDARRLHVAEGYGSLFAYCTQALRLAEHAAYNRIESARLSRCFPAVLALLADGSLNLSTLRLLGPHLTPENFDSLTAAARGRSKREVEELLARWAPRPDVPASVRRLPGRGESGAGPHDAVAGGVEGGVSATPAGLESGSVLTPAGEARTAAAAGAPVRPADRPVVSALAPQRYRVQFTVGGETHDKLRRAQDLLRREIPDGDPGAIFDRALTLLLEDVARKKLAVTSNPQRAETRRTHGRHIPARVKRAVWLRDGGRCAFVATGGRRCSERAILEFHHREPYAVGGEATVANISLRCRAHNAYEAELVFGPREHVSREAGATGNARVTADMGHTDVSSTGGKGVTGDAGATGEVAARRDMNVSGRARHDTFARLGAAPRHSGEQARLGPAP